MAFYPNPLIVPIIISLTHQGLAVAAFVLLLSTHQSHAHLSPLPHPTLPVLVDPDSSIRATLYVLVPEEDLLSSYVLFLVSLATNKAQVTTD